MITHINQIISNINYIKYDKLYGNDSNYYSVEPSWKGNYKKRAKSKDMYVTEVHD